MLIFFYIYRRFIVLKCWFNVDERIRFAFLASINMALRFFIFALLCFLFSARNYQMLLAFTWFISSFIAFASYKFLVFSAEGNHLRQYLKSLLIWIFSYVINVFILQYLIETLAWSPYYAQALAISALLVTNYLLFKHFAFHHHPKSLFARLYDFFD